MLLLKFVGASFETRFGLCEERSRSDVTARLNLDHKLSRIPHVCESRAGGLEPRWEGQDVTRELPWQPVFVPQPRTRHAMYAKLLQATRADFPWAFVRADEPRPEPYSNEEDAGRIWGWVMCL